MDFLIWLEMIGIANISTCIDNLSILSMKLTVLVNLWVTKLIQGVQTHNGLYENARNDKQMKKIYQIFFCIFITFHLIQTFDFSTMIHG